MMKHLIDFLKLRKQNDCVKIALILFMAAVYFAVNAILQAVFYAKELGEDVEYVLKAESASASLDAGINELQRLEGAVCASFQREFVVESETVFLTVTELSEEYLWTCYGIRDTGSDSKLWVNDVAFADIFGGIGEKSCRIDCSIDGNKENIEFIRCSSLPGDEPYAVCCGDSVSLGDSKTLRVMFVGTDITGKTSSELATLGYGIANEALVIAETYEREAVITKVKYNLTALTLSVTGGMGFIQNLRKRQESLPEL